MEILKLFINLQTTKLRPKGASRCVLMNIPFFFYKKMCNDQKSFPPNNLL